MKIQFSHNIGRRPQTGPLPADNHPASKQEVHRYLRYLPPLPDSQVHDRSSLPPRAIALRKKNRLSKSLAVLGYLTYWRSRRDPPTHDQASGIGTRVIWNA